MGSSGVWTFCSPQSSLCGGLARAFAIRSDGGWDMWPWIWCTHQSVRLFDYLGVVFSCFFAFAWAQNAPECNVVIVHVAVIVHSLACSVNLEAFRCEYDRGEMH